MRKVVKAVAAVLVFLTLLSMGVQQVTALATMGSGPMGMMGQQRGIESLPTWARYAVGAFALVIAVGGARKMIRSGSTPPQLRPPPSKAPTFDRAEP
jgi:hypothetical protein